MENRRKQSAHFFLEPTLYVSMASDQNKANFFFNFS